MSAYTTKVQLLAQACQQARTAAEEWKLVAENRLDMLRYILSEVQSFSDRTSPKLISQGIDPSSPTNMIFLNNELPSGDDILTSLRVLFTTSFPDILKALELAETVNDTIDQAAMDSTQNYTVERPQHDMSWYRNTDLTRTEEDDEADETDEEGSEASEIPETNDSNSTMTLVTRGREAVADRASILASL